MIVPRWRFVAVVAALVYAGGTRAHAQSMPQNIDCVECHMEQTDERLANPALAFKNDVHASQGFGCLDCHGRVVGLNPGSGFLSKPERRQIPALCGRCHSDAPFMRQYNPRLRVDQVTEYRASVHGQRLFANNDPNVATCVNCHPAHGIKPVADPASTVHPLKVAELCANCHADTVRMRGYDIPTNQREEYEESVHHLWMVDEGDLSAPTCNDCHGNHGAAPPGIASVRAVCGQCHSMMMEFFTASEHQQYFVEKDLPGCVTCHGNHAIGTTADSLLVTLSERVCWQCHEDDDDARSMFPQMKHLIDSLEARRTAAAARLEQAAQLGMEVSQAQFGLEDATNAVVSARTAIHAFHLDSVATNIAEGLAVASRALERGDRALGEHLFRRQGLAVSVVLILLLIIGIALKIRELERRDMPPTT